MGRVDLRDFVDSIREVTGKEPQALHEPVFSGNEKKYLNECIDSGYVSSVGPFVTAFEEALQHFVGSTRAVAVVNGTAALELSIIASGVKPGDEVLVPAISFVATANAVSLAGGIPHFVDVNEITWGVGPAELRSRLEHIGKARGERLINKETGRPITALLPMHTLGHPTEIEPLIEVAEEFRLSVIEDAAESLGSFVGDRHTGLFGRLGVFSFNGNKTITTGGGGAIVTDDEGLADQLKHLSTTARVAHRYEVVHDAIGFNYRMPNVNAAIGIAQLEKVGTLIEQQRSLFSLYERAFDGGTFGLLRREPDWARSNYWLQAISLPGSLVENRNELIELSISAGFQCRPLWVPLNRLAPYQAHPSSRTPVADSLYSRVICLPSSPDIVTRVS